EGGEDVVGAAAVVPALAVEVLAADAGDGQRMDLAEENAARIELMAAQFRHQAAAGLVVEAPAHQLLDAVVAVLFELGLVAEGVEVLLQHLREPAVAVVRRRAGGAGRTA